MKTTWYAVWCRSTTDPETRWYVLDDAYRQTEEDAVQRAKQGQELTDKHSTNLEYRAVPIGGYPSP